MRKRFISTKGYAYDEFRADSAFEFLKVRVEQIIGEHLIAEFLSARH